ncbi:MAG: hypothetical protein ACRDQ1_15550, partial [Sciscionella sp.]
VGTPAPTMRLVSMPDRLLPTDASAGDAGGELARRTRVEVALVWWGGRRLLRLSAHLYTTMTDFETAADRYAEVLGHSVASAAADLRTT